MKYYNLLPSGRSSERKSEGLRFDSSWGLRIFSLSHARDMTENIFLKEHIVVKDT